MGKQRSFILRHSASSVIKWMGKNGWSLVKAERAVAKLATGPVARTSIVTGLNDGRSEKYSAGCAELVADEIAQLEAAANGGPVAAVADSEAVESLKARVNDLAAKLEAIEKKQPHKVEITVKQADSGKSVTLKEHTHPLFEQVMFHIGVGDNVMLVGPSGCGKTHIAEQIAKSLGREHAALSLSGGVTESKIFGRVVPNVTTGKSEYQTTPFVEMFEKGGVVLLDEVDAADPNVLLSLNLALGNRRLTLDRQKNPTIKAHKNFVCLAAANTWGSGADRQYVGRNQQDTAFNARFEQLSMDYDEQLERAVCPGAHEFIERMHKYRANVRAARLERVVSTRFLCRAYNWLQHGKDLNFVEERLFAGWRADEIRKARGI